MSPLDGARCGTPDPGAGGGDDDYITCRQLIDFIGQLLDGGLPPAEQHEFDRHLAVCPSCVAYLDSYRKTMALGKAAFDCPDDAVPQSVPDELVRAILAARKQGPRET